MKVLFFTENSYCGGLDTFLITLMDHWPDGDDELVLICNRGHPGLAVITERIHRKIRIIVHTLPMAADWLAQIGRLPGGGKLAKLASPFVRYLVLAIQLIGVRQLLKAERPDRVMVVNGGYPAGDSCRAASIAWDWVRGDRPRAVHNIHNLAYPSRWWDRAMEHWIDRRVGRATSAFVAVSQVCAVSLTLHRPAAAVAPVIRVYNGIAATPWSGGARLRDELGLDDHVSLVLMLGTYEPRKGHDFLLAAWELVVAALPAAQLVICGHGSPEQVAHVESMVRERGLAANVHLFGFRGPVDALIAGCDVLLVASKAFESFGLTLVEAMAQKVPVVATTVGGVPEVVGDNEAGYLVAHGDTVTYAERIVALLRDPDLRQRFGQQGYTRYLRLFTAERMAADYARLVKQG